MLPHFGVTSHTLPAATPGPRAAPREWRPPSPGPFPRCPPLLLLPSPASTGDFDLQVTVRKTWPTWAWWGQAVLDPSPGQSHDFSIPCGTLSNFLMN